MRIIDKNKIRNKKKRIGLLLVGVILFGILILSSVLAHENFNETKQLIDSGISCDKLSEEQLDEIGDYYMEQMHPGESHEMMHQMMGGGDSETTKLMHINMAKSIYCGENVGMTGMMGMMQGGMMGSDRMMTGGMGMMTGNAIGSNMVYGYYSIYGFLYLILLISLIVLVILIIIKLLKDLKKRK